MFGISWTEMLVIGVLALLVLGPEKLPEVARTMGRWVRELRAMSLTIRDEIRVGMADDARREPPRTWTSPPVPGSGASPAEAPRSVLEAPQDGYGRAVRRRAADPASGEGDG